MTGQELILALSAALDTDIVVNRKCVRECPTT